VNHIRDMASHYIVLGLLALCLLFPPTNYGASFSIDINRLDGVIQRAVSQLESDRKPDGQWNFGYYLGTHHSSIYFLKYVWLGEADCPISPDRLRRVLRNEQYPDGSWKDFKDPNFHTGQLDSTIINYFALKVLGEAPESPVLTRARNHILQQGGIEKSSFLVKFTLALFGNYPWRRVPPIPDLVVKRIKFDQFAQWISSNFYPVAYIRKMKITRTRFTVPAFLAKEEGGGPISSEAFQTRFRLDELFAKRVPRMASKRTLTLLAETGNSSRVPDLDDAEYSIIQRFMHRQLDGGSWGAYGPATILTVISLRHFVGQHPEHVVSSNGESYNRARILSIAKRGLAFLGRMQREAKNGNYFGLQSYGNYWDTALVANALLEAAKATGDETAMIEKLLATGRFLATAQGSSGGFGFGYDFQTMPDADDTAFILLTLLRLAESNASFAAEHQRIVSRGMSWLENLRNDDGGWPAFDKEVKKGPKVIALQFLFKVFAPAPFLLDPSSADVTGHVLETLATYHGPVAGADEGETLPSGIDLAISYLRKTQEHRGEYGMWRGKWGVNYIYGTSAALTGFDPSLAGQGVSTASQTAWALFPLIACGDPRFATVIDRGINYLLREYEESGAWHDASIVGTGHPSFLYMRYDSYPATFPLMALARYRNLVNSPSIED